MISSMLSFSQINYPRIEKDSLGHKVVVMTIEQAQKIDNNLEILKLLEVEGTQCDSLSIAYLQVIDKLNKQVSILTLDIGELKIQILDKDSQISNLQQQLSNMEKDNQLCNIQKVNDNDEISLLKKEVRKQKLQKFGGFIIGLAAMIGGIYLYIVPH